MLYHSIYRHCELRRTKLFVRKMARASRHACRPERAMLVWVSDTHAHSDRSEAPTLDRRLTHTFPEEVFRPQLCEDVPGKTR